MREEERKETKETEREGNVWTWLPSSELIEQHFDNVDDRNVVHELIQSLRLRQSVFLTQSINGNLITIERHSYHYNTSKHTHTHTHTYTHTHIHTHTHTYTHIHTHTYTHSRAHTHARICTNHIY